jgi:lipid-A-disaccharide synthase
VKPTSFMIIAGEASGDLLAAELVQALREQFSGAHVLPTADYQPLYGTFAPRFFGAGGPRMAEAGVEVVLDLVKHSVIGLSEVLKSYPKFRRFFHQLYRLALDREPDAIICVDFSGFNRRFAHAIKRYVRAHQDWFHAWNPKLIQYVSPQVWASREGRAQALARDYDLLLSIILFEKEWYRQRVPRFRVEFVGHPIVDRYASLSIDSTAKANRQTVLLLPGSRVGEISRHVPVMIDTLAMMRRTVPDLRALMVLPSERLVEQTKACGLPADVELRRGGLPEALAQADIAIAKTGTVTMECAYFGVPAVAMYKTSWSTYQIARRIVRVKYIAGPNLLLNEELFPEFIQEAATAENISRAALALLRDEGLRDRVRTKLREVRKLLGGPGASRRAARSVMSVVSPPGLSGGSFRSTHASLEG